VLILDEKTVGGVPAAFIEQFNQSIKAVGFEEVTLARQFSFMTAMLAQQFNYVLMAFPRRIV
jgi:hypothetical protein